MKFHENSSLGPDGRERFSGAAWLIIVHFSSVLSMESEFPFAFGEFQQGVSFAAVSFFGRKNKTDAEKTGILAVGKKQQSHK
ncbi:MAG: hypothetical protein E6593_11805 [Clostridium sp.]|nr:hypothetical protein [Clostridium sp.]